MIKILIKESYLAMIKNSIGANTFRNFYADVDGVRKDILENGNLSCAFFVSNILHIFKLIESGHTTVTSTVKDLERSGWEKIEELKEGTVLHWEGVDFGTTGIHEHIGFYVGNNEAVSNNPELGYPTIHSYNFDGGRKILGIYWNKKLD